MKTSDQIRALITSTRANLDALEAIANDLDRPDDALLSLADAAAIAGVKPRVLADENRRGKIELVGPHRRRRVWCDELTRWMTEAPKTPIANDAIASIDDEHANDRMKLNRVVAKIGGGR